VIIDFTLRLNNAGFFYAMDDHLDKHFDKLLEKHKDRKSKHRSNASLAARYKAQKKRKEKKLSTPPDKIKLTAEQSRKKEIAKLKKEIAKGNEYFNQAPHEINVKLYKDLSGNQAIILAMINAGMLSTGLMETRMTMTQVNILRNIYILIGKGYCKAYKKLYFPIDFPKEDLEQASKDYWHGCHPVNRDTHDMRMARLKMLEDQRKEQDDWNT
jgi:hypothetical protein